MISLTVPNLLEIVAVLVIFVACSLGVLMGKHKESYSAFLWAIEIPALFIPVILFPAAGCLMGKNIWIILFRVGIGFAAGLLLPTALMSIVEGYSHDY